MIPSMIGRYKRRWAVQLSAIFCAHMMLANGITTQIKPYLSDEEIVFFSGNNSGYDNLKVKDFKRIGSLPVKVVVTNDSDTAILINKDLIQAPFFSVETIAKNFSAPSKITIFLKSMIGAGVIGNLFALRIWLLALRNTFERCDFSQAKLLENILWPFTKQFASFDGAIVGALKDQERFVELVHQHYEPCIYANERNLYLFGSMVTLLTVVSFAQTCYDQYKPSRFYDMFALLEQATITKDMIIDPQERKEFILFINNVNDPENLIKISVCNAQTIF